jgi:hypothetical protein
VQELPNGASAVKCCVASGTITLTQPIISGGCNCNSFYCNATIKQTATVTITVPELHLTPTVLTWNYFVAGNTSTYTDNGSDQVINYQVRDAKGCTGWKPTLKH